MHKEFLMGNAAIALGAVAAGVNVVAGYPGTPSTEVLETIAKHRPDDVYVERKSCHGTGCRSFLCRCKIHGNHEAGRIKCCFRSADESRVRRDQRWNGHSRSR